jgi:hypothetical protein
MDLSHEAQRGMAASPIKNKGEPLAHPHSSSSPGAALGSVPTVALSSAQVPKM